MNVLDMSRPESDDELFRSNPYFHHQKLYTSIYYEQMDTILDIGNCRKRKKEEGKGKGR